MLIKNIGKIYTPLQVFSDGYIMVEDGIIIRLGNHNIYHEPASEDLDVRGLNIAPGFIDLHTHGAGGAQALDGIVAATAKMAAFYASHGVTGFLATIGGMVSNIEKGLAGVVAYRDSGLKDQGAAILGIHLEGPFINPERQGAFRLESILKPDLELFEKFYRQSDGEMRMITLAPEMPGADEIIKAARRKGVVCSAGHSAATWDQMMAARESGVNHICHTFNAMPALHHREPGILGAALTDDDFTTEIIADGIHVHPGVVKLLGRIKGPARVTLITDSVGACGLPDGAYQFEEEDFVLKDGAARLEDGTLCGSVLTMDKGAANLLAFGAASTLSEALQMASLTPARVLGIENHKGQLAEGLDADLIAFDEHLKIHWTMVKGKIVYQSND